MNATHSVTLGDNLRRLLEGVLHLALDVLELSLILLEDALTDHAARAQLVHALLQLGVKREDLALARLARRQPVLELDELALLVRHLGAYGVGATATLIALPALLAQLAQFIVQLLPLVIELSEAVLLLHQ